MKSEYAFAAAAALAALAFPAPPAFAVEGPTAAGPIGGTDTRSAQLPPPGLYGGVAGLAAATRDFVDGQGQGIDALGDARLHKELTGAFMFYVPEFNVLGGSIGFGGLVTLGNVCGRLFGNDGDRCTTAHGDPYLEIDWSRSFGKFRASEYAGAYPIFEGLSLLLGFGVVVPVGQFNSSDSTEQAASIGTNIWDFAPAVAVTYTTPPILAEGTEFTAKLFWNNYLENSETSYLTGDVLNLDFALTERIGRFQIGLAGVYAVQIDDDRIQGRSIPPDGRRGELLNLGMVASYDMPEQASTLKVKALSTVEAENTVETWTVVMGLSKKF